MLLHARQLRLLFQLHSDFFFSAKGSRPDKAK
jgi:hypothetical protein